MIILNTKNYCTKYLLFTVCTLCYRERHVNYQWLSTVGFVTSWTRVTSPAPIILTVISGPHPSHSTQQTARLMKTCSAYVSNCCNWYSIVYTCVVYMYDSVNCNSDQVISRFGNGRHGVIKLSHFLLSLPFFLVYTCTHTHSPQEIPDAEKVQLLDREAMDDSLPSQFYPGWLRSWSILPEPLGLSLRQNHHIWRAGGVVDIGRYTDRYWLPRTCRWICVHLLTIIVLISANIRIIVKILSFCVRICVV